MVVCKTGASLTGLIVTKPLAEASEASSVSYRFTEMSLRNWEVVHAMGMLPGLLRRWGR